MPLFPPAERRWVELIERIDYCNPFVVERVMGEREALGNEFDERYVLWNRQTGLAVSPNIRKLSDRCEAMLAALRDQGTLDGAATPRERQLVEGLVLFSLFNRFRNRILVEAGGQSEPSRRLGTVYRDLGERVRTYLPPGPLLEGFLEQWPHLFALFFQLHRAFENIFQFIHGVSMPAVALRASVWQSIFTHDLGRYRAVLYPRMADYTTLILGPSGTGKELVARAVGLSRYLAFDAKSGTFPAEAAGSFFPVSLAAMSPTLIESELFGHKRGSFTGAIADRVGWLEACPPHGTVFLDEIGDLEPALQVKLLRALQERAFSRLGETETRRFQGKVVAATNRELDVDMQAGRFRKDLYYRLCSDIIRVPSLRERIADDPAELHHLIGHLLRRIVGDEGPALADEMQAWIEKHLGPDYAWPGNVRELEQCLRNVLIRREYVPPRPAPAAAEDLPARLAAALRAGTLTADAVLRWYCTHVYARTGSYEATARQLDLDRRTVRAKVDLTLLEEGQGRREEAGGDSPARAGR